MFIDEIRRAVLAAPRTELPRLSGALWKAFASGLITEAEAQALAETIEARKVVPAVKAPKPHRGARPRSPESLERRRRWVASGWLPPQVASRFTQGEASVLAVVAVEVGRHGTCELPIGAIAGQAGVGKTTVRTALQQARRLGLITVEEHRLSAFRNAPNTVRIVSAEWNAWLRLARRRGGGSSKAEPTSNPFISKGRGDDRFIGTRGIASASKGGSRFPMVPPWPSGLGCTDLYDMSHQRVSRWR